MTHMAVSIKAIMRAAFKKMTAYGFNFIISLMGLPLIIISNLVLWTIIYAQNPAMEITFAQMITYQVLAYILASFVYNHSMIHDICGDIVQGRIAIYQVRPMHYLFFKFFEEITNFLVYGLFSLVMIFIACFFINFEFTSSILIIILGIISCFLAYCINFALVFILSSVSLWWEHSLGLYHTYIAITFLLSGGMLPLDIFPKVMQEASKYLHFQYIVYVPTKIFMGALGLQDILISLGIQIIWIAVFFTLAIFVWEKGIKQFTGYGT